MSNPKEWTGQNRSLEDRLGDHRSGYAPSNPLDFSKMPVAQPNVAGTAQPGSGVQPPSSPSGQPGQSSHDHQEKK